MNEVVDFKVTAEKLEESFVSLKRLANSAAKKKFKRSWLSNGILLGQASLISACRYFYSSVP
jgi:hypothetical protein